MTSKPQVDRHEMEINLAWANEHPELFVESATRFVRTNHEENFAITIDGSDPHRLTLIATRKEPPTSEARSWRLGDHFCRGMGAAEARVEGYLRRDDISDRERAEAEEIKAALAAAWSAYRAVRNFSEE